MQPLYLFFHLPKTGGTTFVGHLYETMKFDEEFIDLGPLGKSYWKEHSRPNLENRSHAELSKIKAVTGHLVYWEVADLFPKREIRRILFVREPVSRVISHYTFNASRTNENFSDWYKQWGPNQMYVFLYIHLRAQSFDDLLAKLEQFWHIGFTEELDKSLVYIYQQMGLDTNYINRRVSGEQEAHTKDLGYEPEPPVKKKYQATKEETEQIKKDHSLDIWLFNHLKENTKEGKYKKPKEFIGPQF